MDITNDFKEEILNATISIETIEVVYKKNKYNGKLVKVDRSPFQMTIFDDDLKDDPEHVIDLTLAEEITIKFFDGTIKTFKDPVS
ncbi:MULTISPECIES: hypothetical protein [unclassified Chryseobacterium]|jgi:hypothetical protein|uniref:hypothetical protein n=1 Tax=unclassified Chryseobacterium TaxID=2593645 RepID=UPI001C5B34F8|nr:MULTISPECIES: hypothetical protein [unclassified Chryseobacterium]MBW3521377.1 hypothetical protein [Chryseobacterium sp. NKUCC03_KSP]MCD0456411.1 hypothetical protein [Chryseobacterium sp. LC2016-27]